MSLKKRISLLATIATTISLACAAETNAQVRRVHVAPSRVVVVGGFYARPFGYYDPWFDPWFGYGYPYASPWWGPYPYRPYAIAPAADVRLDVTPKEAEVYVDGYYAGVVDDFNGVFHKLHVPPGEHEIEVYLDGYRAVHQKLYLTPDKTLKLKYTMERLAPGETPEPRPQPPTPPPAAAQGGSGAPSGPPPGAGPPPMYPPPRGGVVRRPPQPMPPAGSQPPSAPPSAPQAGPASGYGTLAIRVQPGDADVLVDHERWRGSAGQERLVIDLPEGRHTVEVQKDGYRTYVTEIDVRRGETTPLNVSLRSQDQQ